MSAGSSSGWRNSREILRRWTINLSLHTPEAYQACLQRLGRLTPESKPEWGSMSAAQMLAHCAEVQEVANGKDLVGTPLVIRLFSRLIRKMVLSDKPYSRNVRTHPQYVQTEERDFEMEKLRLFAALDSFVDTGPRSLDHPLFGRMSGEECSWSCYKHLNHHLNQFGV